MCEGRVWSQRVALGLGLAREELTRGPCLEPLPWRRLAPLPAVLDVNDETPTFFPAVYNVSVSEDVPREFRVVWLNCTDNDVGLNAELSYFITGAASPLSSRVGAGLAPPLVLGRAPDRCGLAPGPLEATVRVQVE